MVPSPQSSPGWNIVSPYSLRDTSNALKSASARASEREGSAVQLRRRSSSPEREVGGGGNERRSLAPLDSFVRSSPSPCSLAYSSAAKSGDPGKSDRYLKGSKVVGRRSERPRLCLPRRGAEGLNGRRREGKSQVRYFLQPACLSAWC